MVASASSSELKFQSQMCMGPFKGDDLEWKIDNKTREINKSRNLTEFLVLSGFRDMFDKPKRAMVTHTYTILKY